MGYDLRRFIREVTEEDKKKLPTFSYSRLEQFKNCPYGYWLQHIQGKKEISDTLPLNLGSICHKILELKGQMIYDNKEVNYEWLKQVLQEGIEEEDKEHTGFLIGTDKIKKKYLEEWYQPDNASGMNYEEKMKIFDTVVHNSMEEEDFMDHKMWYPIAFEKYFEFVWKDRAILHGYIDRLDQNRDESIRTIDYKTSKKVYDNSKTATSLQFGIYALAVLLEYGQVPVESVYDFILLNQKQKALSFGWEKRLEKALDKIFDQIDAMMDKGYGAPKPSPLCYWCSMSVTNPNAGKYKNECEYYSLWKPNDKNFKKNKEFDPEDLKKPKRKLVF